MWWGIHSAISKILKNSNMRFYHESLSTLQLSDKQTSLQQVIKEFHDITSEISRKIIIVDISVNDTSLKLYIAFMAAECIPLFVNESVSDYAFFTLINSLKPDYVATNRQNICTESYLPMYCKAGMRFYKNPKAIDFSYSTELALLATTSGSTGSPKLVPQTYENIEQNTKQIIESLALSQSDIALSNLPLSYTFGMSVINCQVKNDAKIVSCHEGLLSRQSLDAILRHNVTLISGVPLHLEQIIQMRFFKSKYCRSINKILQAGGRLDVSTFQKLKKLISDKHIEFYSMYGQAEATTRISCGVNPKILGNVISVGKPLKQIVLKVLDENDRDCGLNKIGQVVCSGPNICPDYIEKKEELRILEMRPSDRLVTGDIGFIDDSGYLYITGRSKRFAKLRGVSINLDEIEQHLIVRLEHKCAAVVELDKIHIFTDASANDFSLANLEKALNEMSVNDFELHFCNFSTLSNGKVDYSHLISKLNKAHDDVN